MFCFSPLPVLFCFMAAMKPLRQLTIYNAGYIIPYPVITNFLKAFASGSNASVVSNFGLFTAKVVLCFIIFFPIFSPFSISVISGVGSFCLSFFSFFLFRFFVLGGAGISYMLCENQSLRRKHKMSGSASGVLVIKLQPLAAAAKAGLKEGDIICEIEGCPVQNRGRILLNQKRKEKEKESYGRMMRETHEGVFLRGF